MKMLTLQCITETDAEAKRIERVFVLKGGDDARFDRGEVGTAISEFVAALYNAGHLSEIQVLAAPEVQEVPPAPPSIDGPGSTTLQ